MRRLVWLTLALVMSCSNCGSSGPTSAVRAEVAFTGFHPGCLRVTAADTAAPSSSSHVDLPLTGSDRSGSKQIAVFAAQGWSSRLTVTAEALEQSCDGKVVARDSKDLTLPREGVDPESFNLTATDADQDGYVSAQQALAGSDCDDSRADVHPGAAEQCDGVDDNCDGVGDGPEQRLYADLDGDGHGNPDAGVTACGDSAGYVASADDCNDTPDGGETIHPGAPEVCNGLDDNCNGQIDDGVAVSTWYQDNDRDGYGNPSITLQQCGQPQGYVASSSDCNDSDPNVHPKTGGETACDGVDDDCNGVADDSYNVGKSCTPQGTTCAGAWACSADHQSAVCNPNPSTWYVDLDNDGYGNPDGGVQACSKPAGYAAGAGDCDDGDPYTHLSASEICDQKDNDCNGAVDDSSNCMDAGWVVTPSKNLPGGNNTYYTDATLYPGLYNSSVADVWIGGNNSKVALATPPFVFSDWGENCADPNGLTFTSSWANPANENGYFGGGSGSATGGVIREHQLGELGTCNSVATGGHDITGLYGTSGYTPILYAVGSAGETYQWTAGGALTGLDGGVGAGNSLGSNLTMTDLHGTGPTDLWAVGSASGGAGHPRIFHFDGNSWTDQGIQNVGGASGTLQGVWALRPELAYAVGSNGQVWVYHPGQWTKSEIPAPPGNPTLNSVRAFGPSSVYVVTDNGVVMRWNGSAWETLWQGPGGSHLYDISGPRPDDLWVVGAPNLVAHWPVRQ